MAQRKSDVLIAETAVRNQVDQLRQLVDPDGLTSGVSVDWQPIDRPQKLTQSVPNLESSLGVAFKNRADWKEAIFRFDNARINEDARRNEILPRLDFDASVQYSGVDDNTTDPWTDVYKGEFDTWTLGFSFELPLGNRAARAQYLRATLDRRRERSQIDELRSQVHVEIRTAVREVLTTLDNVEQTREALKQAREQLKGEQALLDAGKSTSYRVLEIQEDYSVARTNERRAILNYMIAVASLERAKGTLLPYYGLIAPGS